MCCCTMKLLSSQYFIVFHPGKYDGNKANDYCGKEECYPKKIKKTNNGGFRRSPWVIHP